MAGIFHAYDVRGIYGTELDEGIMYLIGRALAAWSKASTILVGRDMRIHSPPLRDALVRGITDQGADVVDIGLCSTPLFYWATQRYGAGAMVTASHNPAQYNGVKICRDGARPVGESSGLAAIERLVLEQRFAQPRRKGRVRQRDVLAAYLAFCRKKLRVTRPLTVVVDTGNGMGGYIWQALAPTLPRSIRIIPLYWELDGSFPNHEPNPIKPEVLGALRAAVRRHKADVGIALDGDSDRLAFVDEQGEYVPCDLALALLAGQILGRTKGKILYDVRSSWAVPEEVVAHGGTAIPVRVGHAFIKLAMRKHKALFAGELSGHFYNPEQQYTENTELVALRMLRLISESGTTLSALLSPLRTRYAKIPETNFSVRDPRKTIARVAAYYAKRRPKKVILIDGVRVEFADWWWNLRASNTEPLLRLNLEARTPALLAQKTRELERIIRTG